MAELASSMSAETETLTNVYAALNRNDIPAMVQDFDPQIEWIEPADFSGAGTIRGLDTVIAHLSWARGTWAEGSCAPERFIVAGEKIIVFVRVHVRLKDETEWREGQLADVYTFRNGKVIQTRVFGDRQEALDWVGVEVPDAD